MQEIQEKWVRLLGREDPLEWEMATHSSILAWESPWTGKPGVGGLQPLGSEIHTQLSMHVSIQMWEWTRLIGRCITLVNVASEGQIREKEDTTQRF